MELKDIYKKMLKHKIYLGASIIIGALIGIIVCFLPSKYVASGSFFVSREISMGTGFYTYDGYYGQQTALNYANSVLALMEGTDIKKMVLESTKMPINENTMRLLNKLVRVRKSGPQVIALTVKGKTYEEAKNLWNSFANVTLAATYELNKNGDPNLSLSPVSPQPLVSLPYKSIFLFGVAGALLSLTLTSFCICLKEYFKD